MTLNSCLCKVSHDLWFCHVTLDLGLYAVLYSGVILLEKTFVNFTFLWQFEKYYPWMLTQNWLPDTVTSWDIPCILYQLLPCAKYSLPTTDDPCLLFSSTLNPFYQSRLVLYWWLHLFSSITAASTAGEEPYANLQAWAYNHFTHKEKVQRENGLVTSNYGLHYMGL